MYGSCFAFGDSETICVNSISNFPDALLPLQVRVNLRAMTMKGYSTVPRVPLTGALPSDGLISYLGYYCNFDGTEETDQFCVKKSNWRIKQ